LKHVDQADLEQLQSQVAFNFGMAFDSLAHAAKSDQTLNAVFETVNQKTSEWQEATGRLMQTKSANLFMESASRLQERAVRVFGQSQWRGLGEIGARLQKSFTEGDAALARLKSIELGDALKNCLVDAIEVRSESVGGLDAIIAGALSSIKMHGSGAGEHIQQLLKGLEKNADHASHNAHETLISVLATRSLYRDAALLQIESVLCSLEHRLGGALSPEDIAMLARGEGGTSKLFEPIAKRAMEEINKQLDLAEANITDGTVLEVLRRVRNIMSGELALGSVLDEIVHVLNDDSILEAGSKIAQHTEEVLDALEGASDNQLISDALKMVEKAGIDKDGILREIEKLDVQDLMETAGSAMTDERARRKLLSAATDTALDFVLRILPSMPVPDFEVSTYRWLRQSSQL
jgi:hypothetical protein